jgi:hypothetical protein
MDLIIVVAGRGSGQVDGFGPYRSVPAELRVAGTTVPVNEIGETAAPPDYPAVHDLVRAVVRRGEFVVIRHDLAHYGAQKWHHWLDCVGDCASVPLSALDGSPANGRGVPYLLGPKSAVRLICSLVPVPVEEIRESRPVQTDFRGFAHLWTDDDPDPVGFHEHRPAFVLLGEGVADMHRVGFLHGDLHGANVFVDTASQTVTPIDHVHSMFVCPPPAPALCATDLVPLMSEMSAPVWRAFREGYAAGWPEGRRVIDLIERRDRTGWAAALDAGDYAAAARLLRDALDLTDPDDQETQLMLTTELVRCLVAQGEARVAVGHAERLVTLSNEMNLPPGLVGWSRFNLAVAVSLSGDKVRALTILQDVLRAEDLGSSLRERATQVLSEVLADLRGIR